MSKSHHVQTIIFALWAFLLLFGGMHFLAAIGKMHQKKHPQVKQAQR